MRVTNIFLAVLCMFCFPLLSQDTQEAKIENQLKQFEEGSISLSKLTEEGGSKGRRDIIHYYNTRSNIISIKAKLVVSRCMGIEGDIPRAAELAQQYVSVYTNDSRGWRILGTANMALRQSERAMEAYKKAVNLGDMDSSKGLAAAALEIDRLDAVREILPQLLKLRTQKSEKLEIIALLTVYSIKADDQQVFLEALEGVTAEEILSREDIAVTVNNGCTRFTSSKIEAVCRKVDQAVRRKSAEQKK